jgi:hypothetical protein
MDKLRFCRRCYDYIAHDEFFGYCIKYNTQARHNDTCKIVLEELYDR